LAIKIVFANHKGGVGKTISVLNTSSFLAEMGYKVLCMDFDPQSNLTISFGMDIISLPVSLAEIFLGRAQFSDIITNIYPNLDIVPARTDLAKVVTSDHLSGHLRKKEIIKLKINQVDNKYEFILMDTSSSKDMVNLLTMNCFSFADYVIVPIQFEHFAVAGLAQQLDVIKDVREQWLNQNLRLLGIIGTFYQNTKNNRYHLDMVRNTHAGGFLFETMIRRNTDLSVSVSRGMPITCFNRRSNGYIDYRLFVEELLARLGGVPLSSHNNMGGLAK
jgi:chromosome partitioning protein